MRCHLIAGALGVLVVVATTGPARAEVLRFHYSAAQICGNGHTSLKVAPDGATGEYKTWSLSPVTKSYYCPPKATHMVTFRHPHTCQNVTVPLAFPQGTPRLAYQTNAVSFQYTGYVVRVDFLPDGSVDVVYNSGLFRPIE
jgi:hypothetical protein